MLKIQVMPSLLAADMGRLAEACRRAAEAGADGLHVDIMDGHFVPNLSMGPDVVRMARRECRLHLSVHLMVTRPDIYAPVFAEAGADTVLIHVEAACAPGPVLDDLRRRGKRAGLTLNPETPAAALEPWLDRIHEALCTTVHPGFGGQAFIATVLPKIAAIRKLAPNLDISVDGGIDTATAERAAGQGANILLAGTALYRCPDMGAEVTRMRQRAAAALARSPIDAVEAP